MNHASWALRLFAVAFATLLLASPRVAEAKRWESDEHNVVLEIPDDPEPWEWISYSSSFKKYDIVKAAQRVLKKYRASGKEADGEGARLDLVVRKAEQGETLDTVATNVAVQKFLLGRFTKHEPIEIEDSDLIGEVPAKILSAKGTSKNYNKKTNPCTGLMVVAVVRERVYLLRMYAWHTEYDEEGLKSDLDYIAAEGLSFLLTKEEPATKPPPGQGENPAAGPDPDEPEQDEIIWIEDARLYMVRDGRLRRKEITKRQARDGVILSLEGNSQAGSHQLIFYAIKKGQIVNGRQAPDENIQKRITIDWYKNFLATHQEGAVFKFAWPKKGPYLTLPELVDENREVLFDGKKKKRVLKPSQSEIVKKLKIVQKMKARVGDEKTGQAYRGNLQGLMGGVGKVTTMRFYWSGKTHTYKIFLTIARDGYLKYGDAVRKTLESIHIYKKKPKDLDKRLAEQEERLKKEAAERKAREDAAGDTEGDPKEKPDGE